MEPSNDIISPAPRNFARTFDPGASREGYRHPDEQTGISEDN